MLLDVVLVALTGDDLDQQAERCVVPVGVLKGRPGIVCELDVLGLGNLTLQRIVAGVQFGTRSPCPPMSGFALTWFQ